MSEEPRSKVVLAFCTLIGGVAVAVSFVLFVLPIDDTPAVPAISSESSVPAGPTTSRATTDTEPPDSELAGTCAEQAEVPEGTPGLEGTYAIRLPSGRVLEAVAADEGENGTRVVTAEDSGEANQRWKLKEIAPGKYTIESLAFKRVLDLPTGRSDAGTPLELWDNNAGVNQVWIAVPAGAGRFFLHTAVPPFRVLQPDESVSRAATRVRLACRADVDDQRWWLEAK